MIVLDTHALVFFVANPDQLSTRARGRIEEELPAGGVWVSAISAWEIAMLAKRGRLRLTAAVEDWIARAESIPGLSSMPVDTAIALRAASLPDEYPSDPADRIIAATALLNGAELVTKDRRLRRIENLTTVW